MQDAIATQRGSRSRRPAIQPLHLCLIAGLALALHGRSQELLDRLPRDEFLIVKMGGQDAGWTQRRREIVELDGRRLVRSHEVGGIRMMRLGSTVEISGETTSLELPGGGPVSIESVSSMSARETKTTVSFAEGRANIATTTAGRTQNSTQRIDDSVIGPFGLERAMVARLDQPGAEFEGQLWMADVGSVVEVWAKVVGKEELELEPGRSATLTRVEFEIEKLGMKSTTWYDAEGRETRSHATVAGIVMETRAVTADELGRMRDGKEAVSGDVFAPSMVKEASFLPAARRSERAVLRVRSRETGAAVEVLEDARQRRLRTLEDGSALFELRAVTPAPTAGFARTPLAADESLDADLRANLAPNSAIQSDAPRIVEIAEKIVGDETDPWIRAQLIERWVERNVTDKNFDVGFASALEVAEDRAGDCSEHAVLLAALCRAARIPCRVVMGLLYIGGIWGGHAWNEVWIDGEWYALDGTLGLGRADALHLAFSKMTLADGNGAAEFGALLTGLGKLDVEVLELSIAHSLAPSLARGRIDGDRYVDEAFGVSFRLPEGARTEVLRPSGGIGFDLLRAHSRQDAGAGWRLVLRGYEADAEGDWPEFLPADEGEETSVDGRPALHFARKVGDETTLRWLVRSGPNVFEFRFSDVEGDARALVEAVIASVDFDR
ncbi:MAG: transglutaminase domain-containing protein [Planctomycetes bacterium]|nr:transglutaminase domain-containing protein [Planctomycetota bacterium]